jgi:hypothetical protein
MTLEINQTQNGLKEFGIGLQSTTFIQIGPVVWALLTEDMHDETRWLLLQSPLPPFPLKPTTI